jgi:hypothetical protein|tara:strand:+ start:57 stop:263 length:207 start_codon:yes stop_codon:yes gene_type:complete
MNKRTLNYDQFTDAIVNLDELSNNDESFCQSFTKYVFNFFGDRFYSKAQIDAIEGRVVDQELNRLRAK